jgi:hypothetical protein
MRMQSVGSLEDLRQLDDEQRAHSQPNLEELLRIAAPVLDDTNGGSTEMASEENMLTIKRAEMSGWFLGSSVSSIRRDNMKEWFAWAFFDCPLKELQSLPWAGTSWYDTETLPQKSSIGKMTCF